MNETMYDRFSAVRELNRVEGFDPMQVMRHITETAADGTVSERLYLDVVYRKLWFRLKHPEGAIRKVIREINDQFAIVEAKVYLHRSDPEDSYIANAIVKRYFTPDDKFGDKYLELAETAAVGRALADAGFAIQFADTEDNNDPNVVDTPVGVPNGMNVNPITGEVMPTSQPMMTNTPAQGQNTVPSVRKPQPMPSFTPDMPVEAILSQMTMEYALQVTVENGEFKGKPMQVAAVESPGLLTWYVNSYKGRNNILRAAAKFLLDRAANG